MKHIEPTTHASAMAQLQPVVQTTSSLAAAADPWVTPDTAAAADDAGAGVPASVMLVRNYRSAAPLLELPSRMFYGNKLQVCILLSMGHAYMPTGQQWIGPGWNA